MVQSLSVISQNLDPHGQKKQSIDLPEMSVPTSHGDVNYQKYGMLPKRENGNKFRIEYGV